MRFRPRSSRPRRPRAETPKGFRDYFGAEVRARQAMLARICEVYHAWGFDPLETSAVETVEALGKFLPDVDRPNEGVFAWQDEDDEWLALRYDLTAPLARVYAQHRPHLPTPYRRYQVGPVWRDGKHPFALQIPRGWKAIPADEIEAFNDQVDSFWSGKKVQYAGGFRPAGAGRGTFPYALVQVQKTSTLGSTYEDIERAAKANARSVQETLDIMARTEAKDRSEHPREYDVPVEARS